MRYMALDTETSGLSLRHGCRPFFVVMQEADRVIYYEWDVDPHNRTPIIPSEDVDELCSRFEGATVVLHNSKYDLLALELIGVPVFDIVGWDNIHDTMLMSHAYESGGNHGLKELCVRHLGILDDDEKRLGVACTAARRVGRRLKWDIAQPGHPHFPMVKKFGERNSAWKADMWLPRAVAKHENRDESDPWWTVLQDYALTDGKRTLDLFNYIKDRLEEEDLYEQYEKNRRLIEVTYKMEARGLSLRPSVIRRERMRFQKSAKVYGAEAKKVVRRPGVNLRSGDQLREMIYTEHQMPVLEVTPKKMPSTGADTLAKLHPSAPEEIQTLIEKVIIQRKFLKGLEYLDNFYGFQIDGKVHCNIKITGTQVTRMSINDPPLQTVSKALGGKEYWPEEINTALKEAGVNLRKCFGPAPGREWYALDLSQAHPRIFAWMSGDKEAQQVFLDGEDYYIHLASKALKLPPDKITKPQRSLFKTVNLAQLYGSGVAKLEKVSGIVGINKLLEDTFPTRALYIAKIHDSAGAKGYINTAGGYRLYCPDPHKRVNYTILGTEGEIMKEAMYDCFKYLENVSSKDFDPFVALQVHDELLFDFPSADHQRSLEHARECARIMEAAALRYGGAIIPAEISYIAEGSSWADGVKLE